MDYALETTFDVKFTSRIFATGVPGTLAGSPVVEIYEDNGVTQITAAETLTVDFDSVTGLNNLRIVATAANGFEAGKSYSAVISVGTVSSVSVVGEVICNFSVQRQPVNWANVTAPTTAVDLSATDIQLCDTITVYTSDTPQTGDTYALANGVTGFAAIDTVVDTILVDTATTIPATLATNAAYIDTEVAAILVDTGTTIPGLIGTPATDLAADIAAVKVDTAATLVDTAVIGIAGAGLTDLGGMSTTMKGQVNTEADTALTDYDAPTKAEMDTAHALLATPADLLTTALTEAYAADGAAPTLSEILFLISQHLSESSISSTTKTVKKLDGSTSAATFTLDSATTPTSITRAT